VPSHRRSARADRPGRPCDTPDRWRAPCTPARAGSGSTRRAGTRTQSAMPTTIARPPMRTKKPWLRKNGASTREYGWSRRPPVRWRGRVTLRLGSGDEKAKAAAACRAIRPSASVGTSPAARYSSASSSASRARAKIRQASSGSESSSSTAAATFGRLSVSSPPSPAARASRRSGASSSAASRSTATESRSRSRCGVAAGGEDEHRSAPRRLQLAVVDRHGADREPGERDEQVRRVRVVACGVELL